jgi:hypothetical protein
LARLELIYGFVASGLPLDAWEFMSVADINSFLDMKLVKEGLADYVESEDPSQLANDRGEIL